MTNYIAINYHYQVLPILNNGASYTYIGIIFPKEGIGWDGFGISKLILSFATFSHVEVFPASTSAERHNSCNILADNNAPGTSCFISFYLTAKMAR